MVSFSCETCNDTIVKKKLDQHRCGGPYTCLDCNTTFYDRDYRGHNVCITEDEKYQKALYKGKKGKGVKGGKHGEENEKKCEKGVKEKNELNEKKVKREKSEKKEKKEKNEKKDSVKKEVRENKKDKERKEVKEKKEDEEKKEHNESDLISIISDISPTKKPISVYKIQKQLTSHHKKRFLKCLKLSKSKDGEICVKFDSVD